MAVDHPVIGLAVGRDGIEQFGTREGAARMAGHVREDAEFAGGELQPGPPAPSTTVALRASQSISSNPSVSTRRAVAPRARRSTARIRSTTSEGLNGFTT